MATPAPAGTGGRLNGWKEIAAHLGKGTRTAQRWEKEYGLPVHRVGREGGEIVIAFRDEIDLWSRRTAGAPLLDAGEPPAPAPEAAAVPAGAPAHGRRLRAGAALVGVAAVIALAGVAAVRPRPAAPAAGAPGPPAAWRLANGALTVFDEAGRQVFRHDLGYSLLSDASSTDGPAPRYPLVRIVDLDGDGHPEVLLRTPAARREDRRFYCFEGDGRLRFVDEPRGTARFGDTCYGEPWLAHQFFVTGEKGSRSLFVVQTHNLWFPARLRRLDTRGALLGEYWSNGYVEFVDEVTWRGRDVVLVGGAGNDVRGGSLAIFDAASVSGHAPSSSPAYLCHGCPAAGPLERLTFPSMCVLRQRGGQATVLEAWVEAGDRLTVAVVQALGERGLESPAAVVYYTFGPDLSLVHAEIPPEFLVAHAALEKQGLLDHRFGRRDEADMFPVRRFDADGSRDLPPVPVTR